MAQLIDLRSDTVTKPTPEMWEALKSMDNSQLGDDVYQEDPTVNELEAKAAELMNKEAALLVTSGTQGNLVSLLSQTHPGEEIIVESQSHISLFEVGSAARIGGLTTKTYNDKTGVPDVNILQEMLRPRDDVHQPWTTLLAIENTHNMYGGIIINPQKLEDLSRFAVDSDLKLHMDGARIFNAAVGLDLPLRDFSSKVDSIMFCLSKGMGCPVGSLIAGSEEFITKARKFRKMLGGGMRQAGIIAIMGLIALTHDWRKQLKQDHLHASQIYQALSDLETDITIIRPETNIINMIFPQNTSMYTIISELSSQGLLVANKGLKLRLVTHVDITNDDTERAITILESTIKQHSK
jgi:threonine aldolase